MPSYYQPPVIYDTDTHRPLGLNEFITPASVPLSLLANNQLQVLADGLYAGPSLAQPVYYVSGAGTNTTTSGTEVAPYQTLDYCLAQLTANSGGLFAGAVTVALKAGQTFTMTADFPCAGQIQFAFYGDTNYGDFNGALIGTPGAYPAVMSDLARPVITPQPTLSGAGIAGVRLLPNFSGAPASCALTGVQLNLPTGVTATSYSADFITATTGATTNVSLMGAVINVTDITSQAGFLGLLPRASLCTLNEFASQILIVGAQINGVTTPGTLLAREIVFKFYPDYLGSNQVNGSLITGNPGSAILQINWTTTASAVVTGIKTCLATFPLPTNAGSYGLGNYFTNLTRDQQSRALNVICAQLI